MGFRGVYATEEPRLVGAAGEPAFEGNWHQQASGLPCRFWRDPDGIVTVEGSFDNDVDSIPSTIFTLPTGYRPSAPIEVIGRSAFNGQNLCRVNTDGTVVAQQGGITVHFDVVACVFIADG